MRALLLAFGLVLAAGCPRATPTMPGSPAVGDLGVTPDNLARLTPYVAAIGAGWGDAALFEGFVLVAQHDRPIYAHAFGFADREHARAATADTSFRIGSITKQFTATAILTLEQDGKLSVSDPVSKHLPDYTGPAKDVTLHQLLTHTAGVPNFTADAALLARKNQRWTVPQLLATFQALPLEFTPGTKFAYSNSGYAILGAIVERVSGRSYGEYVTAELFAKAGMTRTVVGDAAGDPDRAEGYAVAGDAVKPAAAIDMSLPFSAGAVRSTAHDLVRWHRALSGDAILGAVAKAKLYAPALEGYAYGWMIAKPSGHRAIWHNGGIDGFQADLWRVPDADLVVIVLSNREGTDTSAVARAAIDAAFGAAIEPPPTRAKATLDPALVPRLIGTYTITAASKQRLVDLGLPTAVIESVESITITGAPGAIEMTPNGQPATTLAPTGGASFFEPSEGIAVVFDVAGPGPAPSFTLEQGGLEVTYSRAP